MQRKPDPPREAFKTIAPAFCKPRFPLLAGAAYGCSRAITAHSFSLAGRCVFNFRGSASVRKKLSQPVFNFYPLNSYIKNTRIDAKVAASEISPEEPPNETNSLHFRPACTTPASSSQVCWTVPNPTGSPTGLESKPHVGNGIGSDLHALRPTTFHLRNPAIGARGANQRGP